jgi:hypothetical protein
MTNISSTFSQYFQRFSGKYQTNIFSSCPTPLSGGW